MPYARFALTLRLPSLHDGIRLSMSIFIHKSMEGDLGVQGCLTYKRRIREGDRGTEGESTHKNEKACEVRDIAHQSHPSTGKPFGSNRC